MTDDRSRSSHPSHWPTLDDTALYGLAGQFVHAVGPHTEADPAALLTGFLVAFGNAAGRASGADVGSTRHHLNQFAVMVGSTSGGRKDTARDEVHSFFERVDPLWTGTRVLSGLSSGEGLIAAVRDKASDDDTSAPIDKRLLVTESEFTSVLKQTTREGNILSEILRQAWDGKPLRTMTRKDPLCANGCHVSILAAVTLDGLTRHLGAAETANGFANRFLFVLVRRARLLDQGGDPAAIRGATMHLVRRVHDALDWARQPRTFRRDRTAAALWKRVYHFLAANEADGLVGALTARAAAHLLRLSCLSAALDCSETVTETHLQAAIALWRYSEQSASFIFQQRTGDSTSDRILDALAMSDGGVTTTQLHRRLVGGRTTTDDLTAALIQLEADGRITSALEATASKPARRYRLVTDAETEHEPDPWDDVLSNGLSGLSDYLLRDTKQIGTVPDNGLSVLSPTGHEVDNQIIQIIPTSSDAEPDPAGEWSLPDDGHDAPKMPILIDDHLRHDVAIFDDVSTMVDTSSKMATSCRRWSSMRMGIFGASWPSSGSDHSPAGSGSASEEVGIICII